MAAPDLDRVLNRIGWLDPLADALQRRMGRILADGGPPAARAKDLLNGRWLGHPLHPLLTDVPIGAWTASTLLDLAGGPAALAPASDLLVGLGCASGALAALAGMADWHDSYGAERRLGLAHALLNSSALGLFGTALGMRLGGRRRAARPLAITGFLLAAAGAYLGGDLVFRLGTQVNRNAWAEGPADWQDAAAAADITPGRLLKCEVAGISVVLTRLRGEIRALGSICSHAGGPLENGTVEDGSVTCPWHRSRFDLGTGAVLVGPACATLPRYEVKVTDQGRVELRQAER
ncbi:MAG: Rieske (2Fe-2S) protein [Candidatus Dormibacteria bacterium]